MVTQIRLFCEFFAAFRTFETFLTGFFLHVILQGFHIEESEITKLATVNNFSGFCNFFLDFFDPEQPWFLRSKELFFWTWNFWYVVVIIRVKEYFFNWSFRTFNMRAFLNYDLKPSPSSFSLLHCRTHVRRKICIFYTLQLWNFTCWPVLYLVKDPNFHRMKVRKWETRSYRLNSKFISFKLESKIYLFKHIIM